MKKQKFNSFITKGGAALSLALAVCAFSACSSSDDGGATPTDPTTDVTLETVSVNNNVDITSRVTYEQTAKAVARANEPSNIKRLAILDPVLDGTNTLSATGVDNDANGNVLVSYHWNGTTENVSGYVESCKYDGSTLNVPSQMSTNTTGTNADYREFNNVCVSGGKAYLVGASTKKRGIIASISVGTDGKFTEGASNLSVARAYGYPYTNASGVKDGASAEDVNSVTAYNGSLLIGSTDGFEIFSTALKTTSHLLTAEGDHVKSVSVNANNDIAAIVVAENSSNKAGAGAAKLLIWNNGTTAALPAELPTTSIDLGNLTPANGKFTVKLVGNIAYVTMGESGVSAYDITTPTAAAKWTFNLGANKKDDDNNTYRANGLDVNGNYVYVAYGANGIYMLNTGDGTEVAHFNSGNLTWDKTAEGAYNPDGTPNTPTMASANAIKVVNGYIYVAQGKDGLVVYKYE